MLCVVVAVAGLGLAGLAGSPAGAATTRPATAGTDPLDLANFAIVDVYGRTSYHSGPVTLSLGSGPHLASFDAIGYRFVFSDTARVLLPGDYSTSTDAWVGMTNDPACLAGTTTGRFTIDQATYSASGEILTFAVRFSFYCSTGTRVRGTIAYQIVNSTPQRGYYLYDGTGTATGFGNGNYLAYLGSPSFLTLAARVVGMATTPDGGGYLMGAADGGVFAYGDARYFGSMGGTPLNAPVVGIAGTPTGQGYWLVGADGGVFAFGDARFFGSTGATPAPATFAGIVAA